MNDSIWASIVRNVSRLPTNTLFKVKYVAIKELVGIKNYLRAPYRDLRIGLFKKSPDVSSRIVITVEKIPASYRVL